MLGARSGFAQPLIASVLPVGALDAAPDTPPARAGSYLGALKSCRTNDEIDVDLVEKEDDEAIRGAIDDARLQQHLNRQSRHVVLGRL